MGTGVGVESGGVTVGVSTVSRRSGRISVSFFPGRKTKRQTITPYENQIQITHVRYQHGDTIDKLLGSPIFVLR